MLSQIAIFFIVVAGAMAYPAISHQSRVDGLGYGFLSHGHGFSLNPVYYYNSNHHGHYDHAWAYPSYKFAYSVYDPHTGDHKSQAEYRLGGLVKGSYSVAEPGGSMRSVHYTADDIHGFNAAVHHNTVHHYIPHYHH